MKPGTREWTEKAEGDWVSAGREYRARKHPFARTCTYGIGAALLTLTSQAQAGMPVVRLTEIASMRLSTISFFLVCFLLCAACVTLLWNCVLREIVDLPKITFRRALGLLLLWGMLFNVVLTMISAARELLTPGAWEPNGVTYRLRNSHARNGGEARLVRERYERLQRLGLALWQAAQKNGGRYPDSLDAAAVGSDLRDVPEMTGLRYNYQGGQSIGGKVEVLASEPKAVDSDRFALLTDGSVVQLTPAARRQYGLD